jgi:membrane protein DedA with SNARE-associated domain
VSQEEPADTPPAGRKLPRPALIAVSAILIGFVVAGYVGDALAPTLVDTRPLLLLLLNPRIRNLVLITNQLDTVTYYVAGAGRLIVSDPLFYLVGFFYGDAAVRWTEHRAPTYGDLFRRLERFFGRASYPMVAIAPNSYVCLLAGAARMPLGAFFSLNIVGTFVRLYLIRRFGVAFENPIDWVLEFIGRYRIPLLVLSVVLVAFSIWSEKRQGETRIEALGKMEEELEEAEREIEAEIEGDMDAEIDAEIEAEEDGPA